MLAAAEISNAVGTEGFAIVEDVLSRTAVDHLFVSLEQINATGSIRMRGGIFAVRNLPDISPEVGELASSEIIRTLVVPILGERFFPVRGILFDKIPDANWKVPWHQGVTIAVQSRRVWTLVGEGRCASCTAAGRGARAYVFRTASSRSLR